MAFIAVSSPEDMEDMRACMEVVPRLAQIDWSAGTDSKGREKHTTRLERGPENMTMS